MSSTLAPFIDLSTRDARVIAHPALRSEVSSSVSKAEAVRYTETAQILRLHALPRPVAIDSETERWLAFLELLKGKVATGTVSAAQRTTLLAIWKAAHDRQATLRRPAVGVSADGIVQASWSFADIPGRSFTLETHRDGAVEWFFRDAATGAVRGSGEAPVTPLPQEALDLLADSFGTGGGGAR